MNKPVEKEKAPEQVSPPKDYTKSLDNSETKTVVRARTVNNEKVKLE